MPLSSRSRLRLLTVLMTCLMMLLTLGWLAYVVSGAIGSMAVSADQMDDARALSAARGALEAMKKQLSATVRDNAYWDDAYLKLNASEAKEWAAENWGVTTADYPLYDSALVVGEDGVPLIAYHKGAQLSDVQARHLFLAGLEDVITAARHAPYAGETLPVAFIRTREGIALVGAAAVQPSDEPTFNMATAKVLVFSKQLTPKVVAEIANTFSISGLLLTEGAGLQTMLHADVLDIDGREIAKVTWPAMHPGTVSYDRVRPTVILAAIILIGLLTTVALSGLLVFRTLRTNERAAIYKAKHDALTGLWNRAGCVEQLETMLRSDSHVYFHILDLDGFKPVNDAWGHPVGDKLIKSVAARLLDHLPVTATVARLGGDEFAVVSGGCALGANATSTADLILSTLAAPFIIEGRTIEIGGSVGWAGTGAGERSIDGTELLRRADLALYRAKALGRSMAVSYEPSLDEDAGKSAELEQELRQALACGDINVAFQPLLDASTRELAGVEALARWTSPTSGPVSPDLFISVAEKAGLIDQLGFQVLKSAILHGMQWSRIGISVNISPLQLRNPYFCRQVSEALAECGFDPTRLTIEVTEGAIISSPDQAKRAFEGLRELGVKIALDDFGCGYASIGTLREFGFDSMKIDRSLIANLDREENAGAVLQATVALANALHLPVTAEGIETEEQATAVKISGCNKLQGFLFSRPLPAEEITSRYFSTNLSRAS